MADVVVPRPLADILRQVAEGMLEPGEAGQRILLMRGVVTENPPSIKSIPHAPIPAQKDHLTQIAEGMHTPEQLDRRYMVPQGSATGSRTMTLPQKKLLTVAAALLFAFLIVPPWDKDIRIKKGQHGYGLAAEYVSVDRVVSDFAGYKWVWSGSPYDAEDYRISYGRLIAQCLAVIVAAGIGMVWLADQLSAASEKPASDSA